MTSPTTERFTAICYLQGNSSGQPCALELNTAGLQVWHQDQLWAQWSYSDLKLESAGDERSILVISNPKDSASMVGNVVVQDAAFRPLLALRLDGPNHAFLSAFDAKSRSLIQRQWTHLVLAAVVFLGLLVAGYFGLTHFAARWAARKMPVPVEVKWGRVIATTFLVDKQVLTDGAAVSACAVIMSRLTNALELNPGYPFDLHVVKSDMVNALALPGGQIVVFTGLMEKADSPDEVAGVLAHEIQHILQRHVVQRLVTTLGGRALIMAAFGGGNLSSIAVGAGQLLSLSYGRTQEREADQLGLQLMVRAGIHPAALASFFERLHQSESLKLPEIISTHPATKERVADIKKISAGLKPAAERAFDLDWNRVQQELR